MVLLGDVVETVQAVNIRIAELSKHYAINLWAMLSSLLHFNFVRNRCAVMLVASVTTATGSVSRAFSTNRGSSRAWRRGL